MSIVSRHVLALGAAVALAGGAVTAAPVPGPAVAAPNTLSPQEKAAGWRLLFDGRTTRGWHRYRGSGVDPRWTAADDDLLLTEGGGGDLETDQSFASFELSFDWKISPLGNSGVIYRVVPGAQVAWQSGPEYQLLDDQGVRETPVHQAGALYDLYAPPRDLARPAGEWNHSRLVVRGEAVEHWLNGTLAVSARLGSPEFAAKVAASKFARYPKWGQAPRGSIVLQDHGNPVAFRNLKIRSLDPPAAPGKRR